MQEIANLGNNITQEELEEFLNQKSFKALKDSFDIDFLYQEMLMLCKEYNLSFEYLENMDELDFLILKLTGYRIADERNVMEIIESEKYTQKRQTDHLAVQETQTIRMEDLLKNVAPPRSDSSA